MSCLVGIVDYGSAGNIFSIKRAVEAAGGKSAIIDSPKDFSKIDKVVLPGVGSFVDGMEELNRSNLKERLLENILEKKKPILGICLGMQILSTIGFEYGETDGLDIINAEVSRIECKGVIPHVGFNTIQKVRSSDLFKKISDDEEFYFMHSYEVRNYTDILALSEYCGHTFVSGIEKEHVFGVQFHPEKSRDAGIKIFENFIAI